ncbi:MAG: tRNA (adenosine(37)-N6)-dimethylallyltransferase MiaA [Burkholderiales bacterium]
MLGPTASGKTGLAIELAQRFPLEIVSVDSALVYRRMNIGTAKPDVTTRLRHPHHLIDIIDPTESYSAARFREDALSIMDDITGRSRIPLLVGGTMLYFKALREGLSELPQADAAARAVIDEMATSVGWPALHAELERVDPRTARRLDPNDAQRIQRALEVFYVTGRPLSDMLNGVPAATLPYRLIQIALEPSDRTELHARIAQRFEEMLELGLIGELRELRRDYDLKPSMPSMRCVGYRQAWQYLEGEFGLPTLREKGIAATRQLAKRQLTWMRATPSLMRFDCLADDLQEQVGDWLERALEQDQAQHDRG